MSPAMRLWLLACCGLALSGAAPVIVPGVAPALIQNLRWRSIGPFRGGRVLAVAGDPVDRNRFYFGSVNGGVWRSDDAGRTWQPIFDAVPSGAIGAIAVAPSNPAVLYVGTGEADMRSDIAQGIGMFRSEDGGGHWVAAGLGDSQQIGRILVDPRDPNVVLVAALGHPYGPNATRGVFRSTDGGRHWARTLFHDANTGAIDLAFQPGHPDVVYAALWQTRRPPWNVYPPSSGPGSGLYKSTDGGQHWTVLAGHGLPAAPGRIGLAVSAGKPDRVFALIAGTSVHDLNAGLFRSDDDGANWVRISADPRITQRGWYFSGITVDPSNADEVYVCDTVVLRSTDGGAHFQPIKGDPTGDDFHTLWIDPHDPSRRILGVDQGAMVSVDAGRSWSSWYNQPTGQFYHVATDNRFPYRVYGAQQDSGAAGVPSRSDSLFDGITMMQFHEVAAGGESDNIAPDPDDPDTVYGGRVDRLDLRSQQMRSVDPTLAFPGQDRATWTLPLVWGPRDHALYFANQRIFRTSDGGGHWQAISPDLSRPDPGVPASLDAPTIADLPPQGGRRRGVVYALAPSPRDAALLWAGTDDGQVWRTTDRGAHWHNVTPAQLGSWSKIGVIAASPFDAGTAYLAIDRHRLDDPAPHLLRTTDGGETWTVITTGLPDDGTPNSVNVVRADPARRGLLYAGTEAGVFVSFDDGGHWQGLRLGLPPTSVRDIDVHGDDLVIATHGRGFYILDDISALRALATDAGTGARLFTPADAIRLHPPAFLGTPLPRDEPMAANPPDGMIIDYVVPPAGAHSVTITVYDAAGAMVRQYRSVDEVSPPDLATLPIAPEWVPQVTPPATSPGAHRQVWDLRYAAPAGLPAGERAPQGVWAPPGRYRIDLTIDGAHSRATAQILPDPRLTLHPGDLTAQFALARRIEADRVICAAALRHPAGQVNADRLVELTELQARLDALARAVDGADAAPTKDAATGFALAHAALLRAAAGSGDHAQGGRPSG